MTAIQLGMPKVVHYGEGNIFEETPFPKYAKEELKNEQLRANLRFVTHAIRNKRARVTAEVPDWQDLRNTSRTTFWRTGPSCSNSSSVTSPPQAATCTGHATPPRRTRLLWT